MARAIGLAVGFIMQFKVSYVANPICVILAKANSQFIVFLASGMY